MTSHSIVHAFSFGMTGNALGQQGTEMRHPNLSCCLVRYVLDVMVYFRWDAKDLLPHIKTVKIINLSISNDS